MNWSRLAVVAVLSVNASAQRADSGALENAAAAAIAENWIAPHVRFLSDSLLEGRDTATRGYDIAAQYVAAQFETIGLEPLLPTGFLQQVPLQRTDVGPDASLVIHTPAGDRALAFHTDFLVHPSMTGDAVDVTAPLVFVAFGLTMPGRGYDDYAGVDARGKIAIVLPGAPAILSGDERAFAVRLTNKERTAKEHGAAAVISVVPARIAADLVEERQYRQLDRFAWLDEARAPHSLFLEQTAVFRLMRAGADTLFAAASRSFADTQAAMAKGPQSAVLPLTATIHATFTRTRVRSPNVVAWIKGSDPALRDELVVFSAHLDHEGIGRPEEGDAVYHGALDNAGGVATILAIARAFASAPSPPRRSVVFLAVTGEEKGLLGSDYFVSSGVVRADRIVADVNCDNFLWLGPLKDVFASGASYSTLQDVVADASRRLGLGVSQDPVPEQGILARSDHYSFLVHGVPSLSLINGVQSGDGRRSGTQLLTEWLRDIHHTPKDTVAQAIDWHAAVVCARLNFLIGAQVANAQRRPEWNGRPFFLQEFGRPARR